MGVVVAVATGDWLGHVIQASDLLPHMTSRKKITHHRLISAT